MNEFELIQRYFAPCQGSSELNATQIGDDAAVLNIPDCHQLVTATDTLLVNTHFPEKASAEKIAYRALLSNISDIIAMGATPKWYQLALTIPNIDSAWLHDFSQGLQDIGKEYNLSLIGGDTTQGSLAISIQMLGTIAQGKSLLRSNAQVKDEVWVTQTLGEPAFAVANKLWNKLKLTPFEKQCLEQYYRPEIPTTFVNNAAKYIHSAIDISDGLVADLGHICQQSQCSATIHIEKLPVAPLVPVALALYGGDDYQICFTALPQHHDVLLSIAKATKIKLSQIGHITNHSKASVNLFNQGVSIPVNQSTGYKHFNG